MKYYWTLIEYLEIKMNFNGMTQNNRELCKGRQYLRDKIIKVIKNCLFNCLLAHYFKQQLKTLGRWVGGKLPVKNSL